MNFHKLIAELDAAYQADTSGRLQGYRAAEIVNEVSAWAEEHGHSSLVRAPVEDVSVTDAKRYLAEAIAATAGGGMLTLEQAAEQLGYTVSGLRKIVDRTKAGKQKPAIQFVQVGRGPIKFRQEWIDDFIAANSVEPVRPRTAFEPQHLKR